MRFVQIDALLGKLFPYDKPGDDKRGNFWLGDNGEEEHPWASDWDDWAGSWEGWATEETWAGPEETLARAAEGAEEFRPLERTGGARRGR